MEDITVVQIGAAMIAFGALIFCVGLILIMKSNKTPQWEAICDKQQEVIDIQKTTIKNQRDTIDNYKKILGKGIFFVDLPQQN
jgi:hypothetical protein